ncbi:MAG: hypothetical protein ABI791_01995 [Acidobacteriota bacterium]
MFAASSPSAQALYVILFSAWRPGTTCRCPLDREAATRRKAPPLIVSTVDPLLYRNAIRDV